MELYFLCPVEGKTFGSDDYSLEKDYTIVETARNQRELKGMVFLNSACPLCGQMHQFRVEDVLCSLSRCQKITWPELCSERILSGGNNEK